MSFLMDRIDAAKLIASRFGQPGKKFVTMKTSTVVALVGVLMVCGAAVLSTAFVASLHSDAQVDVKSRLDTLAEAVSDHISDSIGNIDRELRTIRSMMLATDSLDLPDLSKHPFLRDQISEGPSHQRIVVFDAEGRLASSVDFGSPTGTSAAVLDLFRRQREIQTDRLILSTLVVDPVDGRSSIILSRPIFDGTGVWRGMLAIYIDPHAIQQLFDAIHLPPGSLITLFNDAGRMLVRNPRMSAGNELQDYSRRPAYSSTLDGSAPSRLNEAKGFDGVDRYIISLADKTRSFVITVGLTTEVAMASWRKHAILIISSSLAAVLVMVWLFTRIVREVRRNERLMAAVSVNEEKLRTLLAVLPDAVMMIGQSLTIDFANPAAEKLHGYGTGKMTGLSIGKVMCEASRSENEQSVRAALNQAQPNAGVLAMERRARRKDGSEFSIEISGCPYETPHGRVLVSVVRDVTERQANDLALRRSRENLARAQQVAGIGSFSRDIATGRVEWSDECLRIWGISGEPSQTAIEFLTNLVHPEDRQSFIESREAVLQGKPARSQDFRITRPDGEERTVHHEYSADFDENGKPVRLFGTIQDITERKRIELELHRSREDLARAQQVARIGSFSRDMATGRVEWSDEFLRIWGLTGTARKTTAESLVLLIHPEDRQKFIEGRDTALDTGARMPLDFRITRPDGEERILHREYGVIFDDEKKPIRMFGTVQDITERKKIENEMRRSREDLARAQRIAGIGSFDHDLITNKAEWSDELYRLYGLSPEEDGGDINLALPFVHPEDREKFLSIRDQVVKGIPSISVDFRIIRQDGVERILHRECDVIFDDAGKSIRVFGTLQDVTERKRAELEMHRSRENLARAQRIAAMGSFERDFVTGKAEWSDEMYHILGIEKADAMPGSETLIKLVHPDDREKFVESRSAELKGQPIAPIEYRIIRPDGAERIVHRESAVIFDEEKRPVRRYGTLQDITELRLAERRERELERQLLHSQKLEALGTLAGGIAHDLNNTLVPIMALSKLTARRCEDGNLVRANLETIYQASVRARDLVNRVVAFSRKDESEKHNTDIAETINEALKLLRATIPSSINLEARIGEVPPIPADMTQIHQVVTNLVANASQALGSGIGTITVTLGVLPGLSGQPEICLSVSDTGTGMDEATQQRIFEPFFTTKAVGEGTGLGLSIVHGIVVSHGGRIEVKSEPGKGTRFDLHFPIPAAAAPAAAGEIKSSRPAA